MQLSDLDMIQNIKIFRKFESSDGTKQNIPVSAFFYIPCTSL